jgi:hypothetical protein
VISLLSSGQKISTLKKEAICPSETIYKPTPCDKTVIIREEDFYTKEGSNMSLRNNLQAYAM